MNLDKFKGVFCALNAIYDENDNVDLEKMKALVRVYKSLGVKGVYACGSTGEGFLLSTEERKQVARAVKEAAGDDFTVIVHIGCASTKESIELAKDCEKVGVDAVSAVPCVYYHLGEESVKLQLLYLLSFIIFLNLHHSIFHRSFLPKWLKILRLSALKIQQSRYILWKDMQAP